MSQDNNIVILIPAYKPDNKMINLCKDLITLKQNILIVNDGSGKDYDDIFNEAKILGCTVIEYEINRGKGYALKTGFKYCIDHNLNVVTADADGQHLPQDIIKIANSLMKYPDRVILGVRHFGKETPKRSLIGNKVTSFLFKAVEGQDIEDTQTGLRAFSSQTLNKIINIEGERYEFEMNMLFELNDMNIGIIQEEISVVYIDDNESSHFNAIKDSLRVYKRFLKYIISSTSCAIVDYLSFCLFTLFGVKLFFATYGARAISSFFNFCINKKYVFKCKNDIGKTMIKYYMLVIFIAFCSYSLTGLLHKYTGMSVYLGKVFADLFLYLISYSCQKRLVFKTNNN